MDKVILEESKVIGEEIDEGIIKIINDESKTVDAVVAKECKEAKCKDEHLSLGTCELNLTSDDIDGSADHGSLNLDLDSGKDIFINNYIYNLYN